jgi:hypothetical protein
MTPSLPSLTGAAARSALRGRRIGSRHVGGRPVTAVLTGLLALVTPAAARPGPGAASPIGPLPVGTTPCGPVDDTWRTSEHARVHAGTYRLTLVEDTPEPGATTVAGSLWLAPTSANDRSPGHPGERPSPGDTVRAPLYGSTDVDLYMVNAALQVADLTTESDVPLPVPAPNSWDPLHPGVLAFLEREAPAAPRQTILLIGTGANRRAGTPGVDGVGVILRVWQVSASGFQGTWGPYATLRGGAGYFCAVRAP